MKAMEEGGRIRRGYFVEGSRRRAVRVARRRRTPAQHALHNDDDHAPFVVVLAATDPANPFGIALPWPVRGPQRAAGAFVVIVDGAPVLYLEKGGRSIVDLTAANEDGEPRENRDAQLKLGAHALAKLVDDGRFRRLVLAKYPDELEPHLVDAGFTAAPKGMTKYGPA